MRIAGLGKCRYLIGESEIFVEDETKIVSTEGSTEKASPRGEIQF